MLSVPEDTKIIVESEPHLKLYRNGDTFYYFETIFKVSDDYFYSELYIISEITYKIWNTSSQIHQNTKTEKVRDHSKILTVFQSEMYQWSSYSII